MLEGKKLFCFEFFVSVDLDFCFVLGGRGMFGREGKRYLRVYIQIRFRHACHETRDRQSRSLVSGQEEGWGEVKVLLKF